MRVQQAARHVHVLRGTALSVSENDRELFDAALLRVEKRKLDERFQERENSWWSCEHKGPFGEFTEFCHYSAKCFRSRWKLS